jgi:hypothetical protein
MAATQALYKLLKKRLSSFLELKFHLVRKGFSNSSLLEENKRLHL